MKYLNLLKRYVEYQETSYNFRLGFALSNRPHFNSTYLLRVPFSSGIAVFCTTDFNRIEAEFDVVEMRIVLSDHSIENFWGQNPINGDL